MGTLYDVRNPYKPRWNEIFSIGVTKVLGEENLSNVQYARTLYREQRKDILVIKGNTLAWRKIVNPLKLFVELPLTLLHDYADRLCQMGAAPPRQREIRAEDMYGIVRTGLRLLVRAFIGIPLRIVKHFTSPINTIFRPLVQYAQKYPIQFASMVLVGGLLLGGFVLLSVLTGGTLPFLGAILPIAKLMGAINIASAGLGGILPFGPVASMVIAKAAFVIAGFIGGMSFTHTIVHKFMNTLTDIINLGSPNAVQRRMQGKLDTHLIEEERDLNAKAERHNNPIVISRAFFNTPPTQHPLKAEKDMGNIYAFGSYFLGWHSLRDTKAGVYNPPLIEEKLTVSEVPLGAPRASLSATATE